MILIYFRNCGGRFRCHGRSAHYTAYTDNTIFKSLRIPINVVFRILFYHFVNDHYIA